MKLFALVDRPKGIRPPLELQKRDWLKEFIKPFSVMFLIYMSMYIMRNALKNNVGPALVNKYGLTKSGYADICFYGGVFYGVGKAVLGFIADGKNTKKLLSFLLVLTAIFNVLMGVALAVFGVSTAGLFMFTSCYCLSSLFQSPGGGCSYGTLLRWLPKSQKGKWIGRWNTSHNIGGALGGLIAAYSITFFNGSIPSCFFVTSTIGIVIAIYGWFVGKNDPAELNWDDAETIWGEQKSPEELAEEAEEAKALQEGREEGKWEIFKKFVAPQKFIWILCVINIFVYIVRLGLDGWISLYVNEHFHIENINTLGYFEIPAMIGSIFWGWLSDKLHGRNMITSMIAFAILGIDMIVLSQAKSLTVFLVCLAIGGFTVFGPQLLIGVSVVGYVPKKAMVVTNGLTGTAAYLFGEATTKKWLGKKLETSLDIFNWHFKTWDCLWLVIFVSIIIGFILMIIVAINEEKRIKNDSIN